MSFEFILATDEIREKMFNFLKYNDIIDEIMNTNWTDGVYDKENKIFLTLVDYASEFLTRCGGDYYGYVVIRNNDVFMIDFYKSGSIIRDLNIPEELKMSSKIILNGVDIYENIKLRREFENNISDAEKQKIAEIQQLWNRRT